MIAQRFEQRDAWLEFELERLAVDVERDGDRIRPDEFLFVDLLEFGGDGLDLGGGGDGGGGAESFDEGTA
jgi:hypothetical protein